MRKTQGEALARASWARRYFAGVRIRLRSPQAYDRYARG